MNYEMKSLGDVFTSIQANRGFASVGMSADEKLRNAELVNQAGKTAWRLRMWPDFTEVQQRTYRPPWDAGTTYAAGLEVWCADSAGDGGHYYRALVLNTGITPQDGANPGTWLADPPDMRLYIQFDQPWESVPIDGVELDRFASWDDPTYVRNVAYVGGLWLVQRTVVFPAPAAGTTGVSATVAGGGRGMPLRPWVRFRPPWPRISAVPWNNSEAVGTGTLRYYGNDCWIALRPSQGAQPDESPYDWAVRGIPEFFSRYIELWATSQRQAEDEGKWKTLQDANEELSALEDQALTHTGAAEATAFVAR